jgi:hypothetical protein
MGPLDACVCEGLPVSARGTASQAGDSNFGFLAKHGPLFFQLASSAERLFAFDPDASLLKLRQLGEAMARAITARLTIPFDDHTTQIDLLYATNRQISLDTTVRELFTRCGLRAIAQCMSSRRPSKKRWTRSRWLCSWLSGTTARSIRPRIFEPGPFKPPTTRRRSYEICNLALSEAMRTATFKEPAGNGLSLFNSRPNTPHRGRTLRVPDSQSRSALLAAHAEAVRPPQLCSSKLRGRDTMVLMKKEY